MPMGRQLARTVSVTTARTGFSGSGDGPHRSAWAEMAMLEQARRLHEKSADTQADAQTV
jgi:transcription antitermination factor NusG